MARAEATPTDPGAPTLFGDTRLRTSDYCTALATSPWPQTAAARRTLLHRFEAVRTACIAHAPFLATLGALWLEEGEPDQALLWLERSLMLDPEMLGAQADHALALAALGEPAARNTLAEQWLTRSDVPPALRQRLAMSLPSAAGVPRGAGNGSAGRQVSNNGGWVSYREATMISGFETNLDHSPRLNEITLTPPDGPVDLPLNTPLRPRSGGAVLADLSWQLARKTEGGTLLQTGVQGSARHAPGETDTNWHDVQLAASVANDWASWRGQLMTSATWVGGPLNEPYRLLRLGASLERNALGCAHRTLLETESRVQSETQSADGRTVGVLWSTQCPVRGTGDWVWGIAVRAGLDRPRNQDRPGGAQHLASLGARLQGTAGAGIRFDVNLRASRIQDAEGYSPLLENNATRQIHQSQLTIELAKPLRIESLSGAEALVQLQMVRQSSNLALFRYQGVSTYGGLRWRW